MDAYQYFIDPARFDRGICLSHGLEWATARRTRHPRGANLNPGAYVRAALLGSEPAKRVLQIWLQHFQDENVTEWDDCFYGDHIKAINTLIPLVELIQTWLKRGIRQIDFRGALPKEIRTDYRLPMERESFVWAD
ncbi:TPA: hypothetical protein EYP38_02425, partial [Candidatus Micrarchaeota archaeon]|nr:hypothetical protein [Candidatus Micrarchaeota archaeon]